MKKKINLNICFLMTYLVAFVLLVFKGKTIYFKNFKVLGKSIIQYDIALVLIAIIIALGQYIIQYFVTKFFLKYKEENHQAISVSLLLTETIVYVFSLFALDFNSDVINYLPYINAFIGLSIYYVLLNRELKKESMTICMIIKAGFYLSNIVLLARY